jgi:hypothetical protein
VSIENYIFNHTTPLGTRVRTTLSYWNRIVRFKHPVMQGKEDMVRAILRNPVQIRQSRKDGEGFIVTTCRAESMKEGELLWHP